MACETQRLREYPSLTAGVAGLLVLAACASAPPTNGHTQADRPAPAPAPAPAQNGTLADASYDWHGLVLVPFGTRLQANPIPLHEVLLFHDESQSAAASDNKDCYTVDGAPPRFLGHEAEEYLLCFRYDRLNRIDASVRVAAAQAEQTFARACALWLKDATPAAGTNSRCEGRDGGIAFSARLGGILGETEARVSITLSKVAEGDAMGAAPPGP
ncbi:MAG: hypothetical protein ACLQO1_18685 [Steroidobacteraceae bacterium]